MVVLDGVKYACKSCISGHRSSKCQHTDRELIEVKKKGRPTTQCEHCRMLRKTRSLHARCVCASRQQDEEAFKAVLPESASLVQPKPGDCTCYRGNSCDCALHGPSTSASASVSPPPPPKPQPSPRASKKPRLAAPEASVPSSCCSKSSAELPTSQATSSPSGGSCCSSKPAPTPSTSTSALPSAPQPFRPCCQTSQSASSSTAVSPVDSLMPKSALFVPSTPGSVACFCGPACQCVGCPIHDPLRSKVKQKSASDCKCGELGELLNDLEKHASGLPTSTLPAFTPGVMGANLPLPPLSEMLSTQAGLAQEDGDEHNCGPTCDCGPGCTCAPHQHSEPAGGQPSCCTLHKFANEMAT